MKNQIYISLILLLAASTTVFSVAGWIEYKNSASFTQLLDNEYNERRISEREGLYKKLQRRIEEQEKNEGVFENSKLRDTLQYVRTGTENLLSEADQTPSETFEKWGEELNRIYQSQFYIPENAMSLKGLSISSLATPAERKMRLILWEKEVLGAFESRFMGYCIGGFTTDCFTLGLRPYDQQGFTVEEGEYFKAEVVAYIRPNGIKSFEASMGSIEMSDCATARLRIPTEGLLAPGETQKVVHFTASAQYVSPIGRPYTFTGEKSFVVVRK